MYLPPYPPHLNPDEQVKAHVKRCVSKQSVQAKDGRRSWQSAPNVVFKNCRGWLSLSANSPSASMPASDFTLQKVSKIKIMKMAMNQPYFFPYIGYFQLVASVEKFLFFDDFNFIKNGWINRNRVLINGKVHYITVPLRGASAFKKINEVIIDNKPYCSNKILESLRHAYSKAPYFKPVSDLLLQTFSGDEYLVSELAKKSVVNVAQYIGLKTKFVFTSSIYNNSELCGTERVLDICRKEQVDVYYNLPNGKNLYDEKRFRDNGVNLDFIISNFREYPQFSRSFHPGLSIIDVLMFNSKESMWKLLDFKNT